MRRRSSFPRDWTQEKPQTLPLLDKLDDGAIEVSGDRSDLHVGSVEDGEFERRVFGHHRAYGVEELTHSTRHDKQGEEQFLGVGVMEIREAVDQVDEIGTS